MANWTTEKQPFGANHAPLLVALSNVDGVTPVPISADPATGGLITTVGSVTGSKSNNGGVPGATNLGVLPGVATAAAPTYTEGNQVALSTDLAGAVRVTGSLSVGGTTDNSAFTAGTSTGTPALGFYHSVIDTVTDGRAATVAITSKRAMMVNLQNASGTEIGTATTPVQVSLANTAANATAVKVDGSAVTQPVSGTVTANIGTSGALALDATLTGGTQKTKIVDSAGTNLATVSAAGAVKVDGSAVTQPVSLSAETTKVIGVTRTADGSGNLLTSTTNALDVNIKSSGATVTVSGTVTANPTTPTAVKYGQSTVAVTNTAVQLTNQAVSGVIIQALAGNAGNVVIGDASVTTANGFQLQPGQSAGVSIDNLNRLYVNGTSGDGVCWIGS